MWRIRNVELNEKETTVVDENNVDNELMQKYMAWRHSMLIVSVPCVFLACIFSYVSILAGLDLEAFNFLGSITLLMPIFAPSVSFISVCLGLYKWGNYSQSARIVSTGWLVSLILPIWPGLIPIDYLLKPGWEVVDPTFRLYLAFSFTLQILPLVITVPSGVVRGALRIRCLLPESSLAGWFLVLAAPMIPLLVFSSLVSLSQLEGDAMLIIGTILLVVAPCIYLVLRRLYTDELLEHQQLHLTYTQRSITVLSLIGVLLIGIWAIRLNIFPKFSTAAQFFLEFIARSLTTCLVCADVIFRVTIHQLQIDKKRREQNQYVELDGFLQSLLENDAMDGKLPGWIDDTSLTRNSYKEGLSDDEEGGGPELQHADVEVAASFRSEAQSRESRVNVAVVEDEEVPSVSSKQRRITRKPKKSRPRRPSSGSGRLSSSSRADRSVRHPGNNKSADDVDYLEA